MEQELKEVGKVIKFKISNIRASNTKSPARREAKPIKSLLTNNQQNSVLRNKNSSLNQSGDKVPQLFAAGAFDKLKLASPEENPQGNGTLMNTSRTDMNEANQANKQKKEEDKIGNYDQIRGNQNMSKNTFLFVNDKKHPRHLRNPKLFQKLLSQGKAKVFLDNIFNHCCESDKFIQNEQQFLLNNQFDYMVTQIFRIYIKKKQVFKKAANDRNIESQQHAAECINEFFDNTENYIQKFHKLYSSIYKKPLSDFEYNRQLIQTKIRIEMGETEDIINMGRFLKIGGKDDQHQSIDNESHKNESMNQGGIDGSSSSFDYSEEESKDIFDNDQADQKQMKDSQKVDNIKKSTSFTGSSLGDKLFGEKSKRQKRRELNVKIHLGLNEVQKEQQKCIQNYVNMIFIQHAFSTEDLHALFKHFHSMFHESFEIQKSELTSLFEYMGQNQKLGKEVMEQHVFPLIGIEKPAQLVQQDEILKDFVFSKEIHQQIWELMRKGKNFVSITELLPYYMLFFFANLFSQIEKRKFGFNELLDPMMKASLLNCFVRAGLNPKKLNEKNITYLQIEQALIDFKSQYPVTFSFQQMNSILNQCSQRMNVDKMSRKERHKESFNIKNTNGFVPISIFKKSEEEQNKMITTLAKRQSNKMKGSKSKSLIQSKDCQGAMSKCLMIFDLDNDLISFSQWIAYQMGLQMVSSKIANQANIKHIQETNSNHKKCGTHVTQQDKPVVELCPDLQSTSKYLFEEKIWYLCMVQFDKMQFQYMNFNAMVKQVLLKDVRKLMNPAETKLQADHTKKLRHISQPYLQDISDFDKCLPPLPHLDVKEDNSQPKMSFIFQKMRQNLKGKLPFAKKNEGQVVYLMFNYLEALFKVFKKSICPWATFQQVEQAVFFYIINVIHKCESILADQLELKLIKADIKEFKNQDAGLASQVDLQELLQFNHLSKRIRNRLQRIYGEKSKEYLKIQKQIDKIMQSKRKTQQSSTNILNSMPINFVMNLDMQFSIKDLEDLLNQHDSAYNNRDNRGIDTKKTEQSITKIFESSNKSKRNQYASQSQAAEEQSAVKDSQQSQNNIQIDIQAKMRASMKQVQFKSKFERALTKKFTQNDPKSNQKEKTPGFQSEQKKMIKQIEELVDNLFYNDNASIPKKFIPLNQNQSFERNQEKLFQGFGQNLMSKQSNKFYFKLLQIFGFRDESLTSIIDKNEMKKKLYQNIKNQSYSSDDMFDCFQISYSLTNLSLWKIKNLSNISDFRKIVLQTELKINWNSTFMEKIVHEHETHECPNEHLNIDQKIKERRENFIMESSQDIFNFSFKMMSKEAFRKNFIYGSNLLMKNHVQESESAWLYEQFYVPFGESERQKLFVHLYLVTNEIKQKQQLFETSYDKLLQKNKESQEKAEVFDFLKRTQTIQNWQTRKVDEADTKEKESKQTCGAAKTHKASSRQNNFHYKDEIHKTSHLNVYMTSQYYTGVIGKVEEADQKYSHREQKEMDEKQAVLEEIERLQLNVGVQVVDRLNESGRVKKYRENIFIKKTLKEQQEDMFDYDNSFNCEDDLRIIKTDDKFINPFEKPKSKKMMLKISKGAKKNDSDQLQNVAHCGHREEKQNVQKKILQNKFFPKPSKQDIGPILNMNDSVDNLKENYTQQSQESSDSIDGQPEVYITNDNYFATARQINRGIIVNKDLQNDEDLACNVQKKQQKVKQAKIFQDRLKMHQYRANKYRPDLKSMIELSSRKHLGTNFLEDIQFQQELRQEIDNPLQNVKARQNPQIIIDGSSSILDKKEDSKQFEECDITKTLFQEHNDSLRNDIQQSFLTSRDPAASRILSQTAQSQDHSKPKNKNLHLKSKQKPSKAQSNLSNSRYQNGQKQASKIEYSRQIQDQDQQYYKTSNRWLDQNNEEYTVRAIKTGQEIDDDSRDYDNSFSYKVETIEKNSKESVGGMWSTGRHTYHTDGAKTITNRNSHKSKSPVPHLDLKTVNPDQESNCIVF